MLYLSVNLGKLMKFVMESTKSTKFKNQDKVHTGDTAMNTINKSFNTSCLDGWCHIEITIDRTQADSNVMSFNFVRSRILKHMTKSEYDIFYKKYLCIIFIDYT